MTRLQLLRTWWLPCLAPLLASCGGGGASPAPTGISCTLGLTTYADATSSGIDIVQSGPTQAVARPLTGCAISSLQSARLRLCIQHSQVSELTAQLTLPIASGPLGSLMLDPNASSAEISFCSLSQGNIYTVTLPTTALTAVSSLNTSWNVAVIDQTSNNQAGKFVSWSLVLAGLK